MTLSDVLKRPSAWLPPAMSLAALSLVLVHLARFGVTREADEGTSAHLFQLLMLLQAPLMVFFAVTWLPRAPKPAAAILALQVAAALAAFAPVFYYEL